MTRQVSLSVNEQAISLDYFVQALFDHTLGGIMEALEGTGEIKDLAISVDGDEIKINLNGAAVPLNPFVSRIARNTILAMVSSLKGAAGAERVRINVER